jgi:regulator of sirC expression with transglutaminase-like and TPR domain
MTTPKRATPPAAYRDALHEFGQTVRRPDALPEDLALLIDAIAYPDADRDAVRATLDQMADLMRTRLAHAKDGYDQAFLFMQVFATELGFQGNRQHYDEPDNSYLSRVLERRTGLPILLSLTCVAIARRLGLEAWGLGFPGHFMAALRLDGADWLLDPFNGQVMALDGAEQYLSALFGQAVSISPEMFAPCTTVQWAQRILGNLRNTYRAGTRFDAAARVLDYMLALGPGSPPLWRERALLHNHAQYWERALYDLRRYFFLRGLYSLVLGPDTARAQTLKASSMQDRQLFALYQRVQDQTVKVN